VLTPAERHGATCAGSAHDSQVGEPDGTGRHTGAAGWRCHEDSAAQERRPAEDGVVVKRSASHLEVALPIGPLTLVTCHELGQARPDLAEGGVSRGVDEELRRSGSRVGSAVDEAEAQSHVVVSFLPR
jgi:hypothetical protein